MGRTSVASQELERVLTSLAKESTGARVPEVSMTLWALAVSALKATAGLRHQRQICNAHPDVLVLSSYSTVLYWQPQVWPHEMHGVVAMHCIGRHMCAAVSSGMGNVPCITSSSLSEQVCAGSM